MKGTVEVISGPMFTGKSTSLFKAIERAQRARTRFVVIKPQSNDMYGRHLIGTHDGRRCEALGIDQRDSRKILDHTQDAEIVFIDEVQQFDRRIIPVVRRLVAQGCKVMVAGCMHDFADRLFGFTHALDTIADKKTRLTGQCTVCGAQGAACSQRFNDHGEPAHYTDGLFLFGEKYYQLRCHDCHEVPGAPSWFFEKKSLE